MKVDLLMTTGAKNIKRAIEEAEAMQPTKSIAENLERKLSIEKLTELRDEIPGGGPYTSLRRTITRTIELIQESME